MSGIMRPVKGLVRGSADILTKVDALGDAVAAGEGRLDPLALSEAAHIVDRAGQRLRMAGDLTVVALAGATGAGKSSLFNAITGFDLAAVGVRRPMTTLPLACVWGDEPAAELLDWLGIPRRHQVSHTSSLMQERDADLEGLVLLDLPDHDSTELEHHLIVDRLVELVDVMVWVVSPQKYADAALHNRYLSRLAPYSSVMAFALNHADELTPHDRDRCVADFDRLLRNDGIEDPTILATSATTGEGLADLRALLVKRVSDKKAARERIAADVDRIADRLAAQCGNAKTPQITKADIAGLVDALAGASGVSVVVEAVRRSFLRRARAATGWPVTKWLVRLRPDPLRRLHLDRPRRRELDGAEASVSRTSLPAATPVQRAQVDTAIRHVTNRAVEGLTRPWADSVRTLIRTREELISDELDWAVSRTDLGIAGKPRWWTVNQVLQWLLFLVALAGGLWLASLLVFDYLRLPDPPLPRWRDFPYPTIMLIGGVALGVLVAFGCRLFASIGAKRRARHAEKALRAELAIVADEQIVAPARDELALYTRCRDLLTIARA
jgi:GTPase Era involved in 16S rRNA processing